MFTVISERQEYKLKVITACLMCSNEVCAKCHVRTEDAQLSLRLSKGLTDIGGKTAQASVAVCAKSGWSREWHVWVKGGERISGLIRREGAEVDPKEIGWG